MGRARRSGDTNGRRIANANSHTRRRHGGISVAGFDGRWKRTSLTDIIDNNFIKKNCGWVESQSRFRHRVGCEVGVSTTIRTRYREINEHVARAEHNQAGFSERSTALFSEGHETTGETLNGVSGRFEAIEFRSVGLDGSSMPRCSSKKVRMA